MLSSFELPLSALVLAAVIAAVVVGIAVHSARRIHRSAKESAEHLLAEARRDAEGKATEVLVGAQEKALALEEEADRRDRDLDSREAAIEARIRETEGVGATLERRTKDLQRRQAALARAEQAQHEAEEAVARDRAQATQMLERVAGLTTEQARAELVAGIEEEARRDAAKLARRIEDEARERADKDALNIVLHAAERVNLVQAVDSTVSFIELPSDEMKGRIIGREGRNIRTLEMATGIDVIVDDTPRAILISSFDPIRREIARVAIERLIEDGRIHPARIEEVVSKVRTEIDTLVEEAGTAAAFGLGVSEVHPRLARLIGRMKFRTHHGHNLLQHCTEVALIAGHVAAEVGARADVVHRAGLLHEVGRVDETTSGHTALASAELASRYGESEDVVRAIQSLHPDADAAMLEGLLLRVANRISDNRPGARKENLEVFIERLRRLESIALSFPGVSKAYAIKAGKELRVILDTGTASDEDAYALSKNVASAIERDLIYSGQIKVSVVRETRAVQFAL